MGSEVYYVPMQENGRIILPIELRRVLGLTKGDQVVLLVDGDTVTLTTPTLRRYRAQEIAASYAVSGTSVVDEFLDEKRAEAKRENSEDDAASGASAA